MHHPDFGRISLSAARRDTEQVFSALAHTIGHPVRLYRPPHGHLTLRTALMLRRLKAETWLWGIDSGDWREESTVDSILDRSLHALDGGVVLMHDTTDKTVEATRLLLERLSSSRVQTLALWAGTSG
ncbi:unannotated protein [freshwater metagenome]|uniref:Unannotated protein n=1 Tax=freshwater metagenome TaxID=449393 RepID=A0A6J7D177_9ZZZZ